MIIDFQNVKNMQGAAIEAERTEEFYSIARELSEFIKGLPLSQPDNDKLIAIIIKQVQAGEQGTFNQGFHMGYNFAKWQTEHPEE